MRQGFRVIDSDTHVNPSLDVLLRYADEDLKARIDDLQPYRRTVKTVPGRGDAEDVGSSTILSIRPVRLQRVAGQKSAPAAQADGDRGFLSGRTQMVTRQPITPRVAEDNARGRLRDMDLEGRDIDFIIPGPWAYGAPALAPHLAQGLYRAYHRYMADYCAADSRRLKSMILALATDPVWSAQVIKEHAQEDWVAAVWPLLPEGMPIDDPDLEPIWAAADEADLPIMYHAFTVETPYFPGYRDIWDNPAMGRCAGQTWGGQRFLSFMLMGGMLDRYPRLRVGALESGDRSPGRSRAHVRVGLSTPGDHLSGPRRHGHRVAPGAGRGSDPEADVAERGPLPAPGIYAVERLSVRRLLRVRANVGEPLVVGHGEGVVARLAVRHQLVVVQAHDRDAKPEQRPPANIVARDVGERPARGQSSFGRFASLGVGRPEHDRQRGRRPIGNLVAGEGGQRIEVTPAALGRRVRPSRSGARE